MFPNIYLNQEVGVGVMCALARELWSAGTSRMIMQHARVTLVSSAAARARHGTRGPDGPVCRGWWRLPARAERPAVAEGCVDAPTRDTSRK